MRVWLARPMGRIIAGAGLLLVVALVAVAFYIYGPGPTGGATTAAGSGATTAAPTLAPTTSGKLFTLDASASQASFSMHEVLFGQPRTVVGTTNGVSGQIQVDQTTPSQSKVGQIRVDLTGLTTDSDMRNQTIQNRILETGAPANQYAVFVAQSISGLPSSIAIGQKVSFTLAGNLTIHQVTRPVTFAVTATLTSATQLTGQAQATVRYSDFNIAIPNVPSVTGVSDTTALALSFTANA